jgi:phosphatidylglycerophosphate synthase
VPFQVQCARIVIWLFFVGWLLFFVTGNLAALQRFHDAGPVFFVGGAALEGLAAISNKIDGLLARGGTSS